MTFLPLGVKRSFSYGRKTSSIGICESSYPLKIIFTAVSKSIFLFVAIVLQVFKFYATKIKCKYAKQWQRYKKNAIPVFGTIDFKDFMNNAIRIQIKFPLSKSEGYHACDTLLFQLVRLFGVLLIFIVIVIIVIPHVFVMQGLYLEKNWKNLNRGVHFCLFLPFCLLIISNLRCVYPPPKSFFSQVHFDRVGCTLCYLLTVRVLCLKMGKSAPPYLKTFAKNILNTEITKETSFSPPFQVRYKSVSSPFQNGGQMGGKWDLHGICLGITKGLEASDFPPSDQL